MLSSFPCLCGILCMRMNLGIYIQVPFCQTKCTYCNFDTGVFAQSTYDPYASAVCRELAEHAAFCGDADAALEPNFTVDTVYIGGGTPSLLAPATLARSGDQPRQPRRAVIQRCRACRRWPDASQR